MLMQVRFILLSSPKIPAHLHPNSANLLRCGDIVGFNSLARMYAELSKECCDTSCLRFADQPSFVNYRLNRNSGKLGAKTRSEGAKDRESRSNPVQLYPDRLRKSVEKPKPAAWTICCSAYVRGGVK